MPQFVSKPRVKEGISPSDPRDLTTKEYVDSRQPTLNVADGGGPQLGVRLHVSVDAGAIA